MRVFVIALAAGIVSLGSFAPGSAAKPQGNAMAPIPIVATADQKFVPDHVVMHVGKRQMLRFTSTGGVHGVASKELGIPLTTITPDKAVSVSVLPTKAGTYTVPCAIVCGAGHADMILTIEVKR